MSKLRFLAEVVMDSEHNEPDNMTAMALLTLSKHLTTAAALTRAFDCGDWYGCELSKHQPRYGRLWKPGCGRPAP